nr:proteinase inhibitor PSI-1.2-like [Ipomoea batatas]GMD72709.1 proteinase inhibitor PSI-1.2-like [Ipomoea batatas]
MAATASKIGFLTLLVVWGILVLGSNMDQAEAQACPRNCDPNADYMICPPRTTKIRQICQNCCTAKARGCQLYRNNGSPICN